VCGIFLVAPFYHQPVYLSALIPGLQGHWQHLQLTSYHQAPSSTPLDQQKQKAKLSEMPRQMCGIVSQAQPDVAADMKAS